MPVLNTAQADLALDHYKDRQATVIATAEVAGQMWSEVNPNDIARSWAAQVPELTAVVTGAQLGVARPADAYVAASLDAQGASPSAAATVAPEAFSGTASDGRGLASLLLNPGFMALQAIASGHSPDRALAAGRANLDMIARTQVADAGRLADQVSITAHPAAEGYVRMANGPTCARCMLLVGRIYGHSEGFQRHPRCDCIMIPTAIGKAAGLHQDPAALYQRLSPAERSRAGFSLADQRAIAQGADLGQVVNSKAGMYVADDGRKYTTVSTTRRGVTAGRPRLTVGQIYRDAADRDDALRLLTENGYIRAVPAERDRFALAARRAPAGAETAAQLATAQGIEIRPVLAKARTITDVERAVASEIQVITGNQIPVWFGPDASPLTAREHGEGILRVLERFPDTDLRRISWISNPDIFAQAGDGVIEFTKEFSTVEGRAKYLRSLRKGVEGWDTPYDWASSFSFRGSANPASTAIHEMAHILELDTIGASLAPRVEALVDEIAERLVLQPSSVIRRQVSQYAATDTRELIADGFGDAILNGERASELSRGILQLIEEEYAAGGNTMFTAEELAFGSAPRVASGLAGKTVAELRALARERGLRGYSAMRKADLVRLLEEGGSVTPAAASQLAGRTVAQLRVLARERGIRIPAGSRKADIVRLLEAPGPTIDPATLPHFGQPMTPEQARVRTALIDEAMKPAEVASAVYQLVGAEASPAAIASRLHVLGTRLGVDTSELVALTDRPVALLDAVDAMAQRAGLTRVNVPGERLAFDRQSHRLIGEAPRAGEVVEVVSPGYTVRLPSGEVIRVSELKVEAVHPSDPVGAVMPERVVAYPTRQEQLRGILAGEPLETRQLGGGLMANTDLMTYPRGEVVWKVYGPRTGEDARQVRWYGDAEELAGVTADAVGMRAPTVVRMGGGTVVMDYVEGTIGADLLPPGGIMEDIPAAIRDTDDGRIMGLFDILTGNGDRNEGNWIRTSDGRLFGIDHGFAFIADEPLHGVGSPFAEHFATRSGWLDNDMTRADLELVRGRLEAVRPEFVRLRRQGWHDLMMRRLEQVTRHATGTRDRLT